MAHLLDQPNDLDQSLERKILALDWGEELVGGGERVAHENA
jgi:hypothetical protein